jgi:hypothetical protein
MGAQELIWRAGADAAVTTADGGRDLEAVFNRPSPDGMVEQTRWWVEAKGRSSTVKKSDVVDAVSAMVAHPEVDLFVFCTNSRFSNPTRDWVEAWQRTHPRPKVRLWDRDHLDRLVRQYPLVAARSLPEALDVRDRLALLVERFEGFGETPTSTDLEFFWGHSAALSALEPHRLVTAVAMFAYAEGDQGLVDRPWASLLPTDGHSDALVAVLALTLVPALLIRELARPLGADRLTATAAYLLLSCMPGIRPEVLNKILTNPNAFLEGTDSLATDEKAVKAFFDAVVKPVWGRVHDELMDVCADDCRRVLADPGAAFPKPLVGERYWRRFGVGKEPDNHRLVIENSAAPCTVGLNVTADHGCPLNQEPINTVERVAELIEIVKHRRANPENHAYKGVSISDSVSGLTSDPKIQDALKAVEKLFPGSGRDS